MLRHRADIEGEVEVDHTAGGQRMHQDSWAGVGAPLLGRHLGCLLWNVRELQRGHSGQSLCGIWLLSQLLDELRLLDDLLNHGIIQCLLVGLQAGLLRFLNLLAILLAWSALHHDLVAVAQELVLDELLEDLLSLGDPGLEIRQWLLKAEWLKGIVVIVPALNSSHHQGQSLWEAAGVHLAVPELDGVDCGLHCILWEASLGELLQGLSDQCLNLLNIFLGNVLEADTEHGLQQALVQATSDDSGTEATVHQGLVEWCSWGAHEQVVQEGQGPTGLHVHLTLVDEPAH
mmetsp:Transcript_7374/g.16152  ORF Transcript_7374/g.16152 Transcript_7374/m.16152 type:complete len:288 (+) Transcript_7374:1355-2218(+)